MFYKPRPFGQINTELGKFHGSYKVYHQTNRMWKKTVQTGTESVKNAAKTSGPVTVTCNANVS